MATASVNYVFANGTNADGTQVNANFNSLVTFANTEVIHRDASIAFTAIPTLPATDPVNDNDVVRKRYVDLIIPAGTIVQFGGSAAPSGWVLCDGTAYSRVNATYSRLYAAITTTFGVGDGSTTFNVPDLRGRFPVGRNASDASFDVLAEVGGTKTETLTSAQIPSHTHGVGTFSISTDAGHSHSNTFSIVANGDHSHGAGTYASVANGDHAHGPAAGNVFTVQYSYSGYGVSTADGAPYTATNTSSTSTNGSHGHSISGSSQTLGSHSHTISGSVSTGGSHNHTLSGASLATGEGQSHNNLPPYIVVNYIIKL